MTSSDAISDAQDARQAQSVAALHPDVRLRGQRRPGDRARIRGLRLRPARQALPRRARPACSSARSVTAAPRSPRPGARQAAELAYFPLWSYAHPRAIELAERLADLAPGDLNRVFFTTSGSEAVESAWKLAKQYFKLTGEPRPVQGAQPGHRLPRHVDGRAGDHRAARHQAAVRAAACRAASGCRTPTSTGRPASWPATRWTSASGPRRRSSGPSCARARSRSPRCSSSRCRTPAAASRRRPGTSSGCGRSATSTACCSSPTR